MNTLIQIENKEIELNFDGITNSYELAKLTQEFRIAFKNLNKLWNGDALDESCQYALERCGYPINSNRYSMTASFWKADE